MFVKFRLSKIIHGSSALLLAVFLSVIPLQGCSREGDPLNAIQTDTPGVHQVVGNEPVTLKWYWSEGGNVQLPEESYICKKILKDLNIRYIHLSPRGNNFMSSLDLLLASQDIPDIMESNGTQTTRFIQNRIIIPVEKYVTPEYLGNVMKLSNNWDEAKKIVTRTDGHIWAVPVTYSSNVQEVPWIRYDWLKNLGLEVPQTLDELENVLVRFTQEDPDGNKENDTVGTMIPDSWMPGYELNMGCKPGDWYKDSDGKASMGMFLERQKALLKYIKSLVDSGACDKEMATTTGIQLVEKMRAGKVGFVFAWLGTGVNKDMKKTDPKADWRPMPPPKGVYDKGYLPSGSILRGEYIVSASCKNVESVFKLMNYMAEDFSTPEKLDFSGTFWEASFGQKGVDWNVTPDGKFDRGNYNPQIGEQLKIDNWAGISRRWRNKYEIAAFRSGMSETEKRDAEAIDSYPLATAIPRDHPFRAIDTEGVEFPAEVAKFQEDYVCILWQEFTCKAILGKVDIDKGWEDFVNEAYQSGYGGIRKAVTGILEKAGKLK
jgi:ABC-type glycerol-3-phosphate transport system substrate-binding protein